MSLIPINQLTDEFEYFLNSNSFSSEPKNLYEPLSYFLSLGGKRIRPMLVILSYQLFDENYLKSFPAATSIEYFHNFSLIHDDIMDEAPLRRGKESIHKKWNLPIAILSGDVLLIKAYQQLQMLPQDCLSKCFDLFNKTAVEVCEGQQLDMDFEQIDFVSTDDYLEMIKLKTSVLLASSLKMGAIIAKADTKQQDLLYNLGIKLGLSFQIQDDFLDLYNENPLFGKIKGGDLLQNKKTILATKAIEIIGKNEYKKFQNEISSFSDEGKVAKFQEFFIKIGVVETIKNIQNEYTIEIKNNIDKLKTNFSKDNINYIFSAILDRKH